MWGGTLPEWTPVHYVLFVANNDVERILSIRLFPEQAITPLLRWYIQATTMNVRFEEHDGSYPEFDWDENKRARCIEQRGIDFADVARYFFGRSPFFRRRCDRDGEERWQAIGYLRDRDKLFSIVYTERKMGAVCRIISARRARDKETEEYHVTVSAG